MDVNLALASLEDLHVLWMFLFVTRYTGAAKVALLWVSPLSMTYIRGSYVDCGRDNAGIESEQSTQHLPKSSYQVSGLT